MNEIDFAIRLVIITLIITFILMCTMIALSIKYSRDRKDIEKQKIEAPDLYNEII